MTNWNDTKEGLPEKDFEEILVFDSDGGYYLCKYLKEKECFINENGTYFYKKHNFIAMPYGEHGKSYNYNITHWVEITKPKRGEK